MLMCHFHCCRGAGGLAGEPTWKQSCGVLTHGPVAQSIPQQRAVWPCAGVMGKRGSCLDFGFGVSLSERWPARAVGKATVMPHCGCCSVVGNVVSLHFLTLWTHFKNCDTEQEGKMPRHNQLTQRKLNLDRQYEKPSLLKSVVKFPLMSEVLLFYPRFSWILYVHKSHEVAATS